MKGTNRGNDDQKFPNRFRYQENSQQNTGICTIISSNMHHSQVIIVYAGKLILS